MSLALTLFGCQPGPPPEVCARDTDRSPTTDSDVGTTSDTAPISDTGTPVTGIETVLDPGAPVSCADTTLRATNHFHLKATEFPGTLEGAYLWGGGAVVEDFDGDGDLDMFVVGGDAVQLWSNDGGDEFTDRTRSGIPPVAWSRPVGGSAADYDGDGDQDLVVTQWGAPTVLLRNEGRGTFTDATPGSGLDAHAYNSQSASWADIDRDGDLDLFVGSYGEFTIIDVTEPVPDCSDHVAQPSELYRNDGDGTFTDISDRLPDPLLLGGQQGGYVFASGFYDIDADGCPELFTSHDDGGCSQSLLVDNDCSENRWVVDSSSLFHAEGHDMGMGVGDLNGDLTPDFLLTSWKTSNTLLSFPFAEADNGYRWLEETGKFPLAVDPPDNQVFGWGAEIADLDNDADLDGIMLFGFWSTYEGQSDPRNQMDGVWLQDDEGHFSDVAGRPEWNLADDRISRGVVLADINDDGWLDVIKRELRTPTRLYISECGEQAWVKVRLRAPAPNTRAVGATIRVTTGSQVQVRWMHAGSTGLYTGLPLEAHFGLGEADAIDLLEVVWPDGEVSAFSGVSVRRTVTVTRR